MDEADVSGKAYTAKWYQDPVRMMKSYKRTLCNMQTITLPFVPEFLLRSFTNIMMPAYLNGDLCEKFASGKESIRPMVFSHGLSADKNFYMAIYLAMASHGYMVVAINHQDESCFYTEDAKGNEIWFLKKLFYSAPLR